MIQKEKEVSTMKNVVIVLDGPVGVGKTTLMNILEKEGFTAFPEPVIDNPLLEKFYYDRKRYAFPLQIFFLNKRFEHIKKTITMPKVVMDRSIYGDVVFAKMLRDGGDMTFEEFDIYEELLNNMLEHSPAPTLMVNLEVSVDEAIKRINKRGRSYELVTERKYWEDLNRNYREFFAGYNHSPLLTLNVDNLNYVENKEHQDYVVQLIKEKLNEINK